METALVTGATGFVGSNLARHLLDQGFRVRALLRPGTSRAALEGLDIEPAPGDLEQPQSLIAACRGVRYVFHAAADYRLWVKDPKAMFRVNVDGTRAVLEAALRAGVERIVYTSSVSTIQPRADGQPASELDGHASADHIVGDYKRSKWFAEAAALEMARRGAPIVVVNPAAPVGPWDAKPTPTGRVILDFLLERMPAYIDTGWNLVDVRDVARGHLAAAKLGRVGERYILGAENLSLRATFVALAEVSGIPAPDWRLPYPAAYAAGLFQEAYAAVSGTEPRFSLDSVRMARTAMYYDSAKARVELGFRPGPVRTALADACAWFVEHGRAPLPPRLQAKPQPASVDRALRDVHPMTFPR